MFPMEKLFTVQSYDERHRVFLTSDPETGEKHFACIWVTAPLTGIDSSGVTSIVSALSISPKPGSIIQFGLLSTPDITDSMRRYRKSKLGATDILDELVTRNALFVEDGVNNPLIRSSCVRLHRKKLIVTFKEPTDSFDELFMNEFAEKAVRFSSSLSAAKISLEKLTGSGYLELAREMNHIFEPKDARYDEDLPINEQLFYAGDHIDVYRNRIAFATGSNESRHYSAKALSVKFFPETTALSMMNHIIGSPSGIYNQITDPFYFVSTFIFPDQYKKKEYVKAKSTWINHQSVGPMGRLAKVKFRKSGIDPLINEIDAGNAVVVDFNFTGWIFAKTEKDLNECVEKTRTFWDSIGLITKEDSFILDALWANTFPINTSSKLAISLKRFHSMTTNQATQFIPLYGESTGPLNPVSVLVTRRGELGGFDLFSSDGNYNAIVAASSGSGKSYLTQRIIVDHLAQGHKVWVIDSGHSYKKLAASLGDRASYIELDPENPQVINPFSQFLPQNGGESKNFEQDKSGIVTIFERMASTRNVLNDTEIALLSEAIDAVFQERRGDATVRLVQEWLLNQPDNPTCQKLGKSLYEFAIGGYASWFNGQSNVNLDNDFVVLELDNLKGDERLMSAVLSVLMNQINDEMYKSTDKGRKKILLIDEGWRHVQDRLMIKSLTECFRTVRKYNGACVLITQDISDLYQTEESQQLINNASWMIVLHQKETAIAQAIKSGRLAIDDYGQFLMKGLVTSPGEYSDLMIINNGNYSVFRLVVDRFSNVLFSTKGEERNEILLALSRGENVIDAIEKFIVGQQSYDIIQQIKHLAGVALSFGKNLDEIKRYLLKLV